MLPSPNRLKSNREFSKVHKQGKFFGEKFLAIRVAENGLQVSRFGFIVGIKASKKAVVRNKIKRRMRAVIEKQLSSITSGYDIVVMVRPEIAEKDFNDIGKALQSVLSKAGLMSIK